MPTPHVAPYGSWKSPITSDLIVAATIGLGSIILDEPDIYWTELRPSEGGRNVIVRRTPDGRISDALPAPFNARTRVHEYGGGPLVVHAWTNFFSHYSDQRGFFPCPAFPPRPIMPPEELRSAVVSCGMQPQLLA